MANLWPECEIRFFIKPEFSPEQSEKIRLAFREWAKHVPRKFVQITDQSQADITLIYRTYAGAELDKYKKEVVANCPSASPVPLGGRIWPTPPVENHPDNEVWVNLNSEINWDGKAPSFGNPYPFYPTALHEIGHALGLGHIDHPDALMYCFSEGQASPAPIDIKAIKPLYPVIGNCLNPHPIDCVDPDTGTCPPPETDKLVDQRDGQEYDIVKIGERWWMAENLNYDSGPGSFCYNDSLELCGEYGRLYYWDNAMNGSQEEGARGVCPAGWHLPSQDEITLLVVGLGHPVAAKLLKGGCSGFDAVLSGRRDNVQHMPGQNYYNIDDDAYFWTSTDNAPSISPGFAVAPRLNFDYCSFLYIYWYGSKRDDAFSVRCIKNP